jgi:hypothetical protein
MLSFNISYPDLIKNSYFADTTERGDRGRRQEEEETGGETEDDFTEITLKDNAKSPIYYYQFLEISHLITGISPPKSTNFITLFLHRKPIQRPLYISTLIIIF